MKPLSTLVVDVKRIIDQSPRSDWTSDLVRGAIEYKIQHVYSLNPEKAPKMPSMGRIQDTLKFLSDNGDIKKLTHQEGRLRYNTYERIEPEPERGSHGIGVLALVGVVGYLIGYMGG